MTDIVIREMERQDIPRLCEIENACFSRPWTAEGFEAELDQETAHFFVAQIDGVTAGYMGFHSVLDEGYIANIAVLPRYRRMGAASRLLDNAFEKSGKLGLSFLSLEVRKSNEAAIALYRRYGFETVGERKNFYSSPTENALIMTAYFDKKD